MGVPLPLNRSAKKARAPVTTVQVLWEAPGMQPSIPGAIVLLLVRFVNKTGPGGLGPCHRPPFHLSSSFIFFFVSDHASVAMPSGAGFLSRTPLQLLWGVSC